MVMSAIDEGISQEYLCMSPEIMLEVHQPILRFGLDEYQPSPNNSLQRTHQSVTLFASQKLRLFAVPLSLWTLGEAVHSQRTNARSSRRSRWQGVSGLTKIRHPPAISRLGGMLFTVSLQGLPDARLCYSRATSPQPHRSKAFGASTRVAETHPHLNGANLA